MRNGTNDIKRPVSQADIYAYEKGWAEEMVNIWKEKIMHYRIRHTGALFSSVQATSFGGSSRMIAHKFLLYGLYQEAGVGNGYYHGNPGDLHFLDPESVPSTIWASLASASRGSTKNTMPPS